MNYRLLRALAVGVVLAGSMVAFSGSAHAISGPCWFTSLGGPVAATTGCSEVGLGDYGVNDVFSGRTSAGDYSAFSHVNTKTEFINFIVGCFQRNETPGYCTWGTGTSAVSDQNQIGAAFTISTMLSDPSRTGPHTWPTSAEVQRWVDLVSNPRTVVYTVADATVGDTSWYDNDKKNDFFSDHPRVRRDIVKVRWDSNNNGIPDKDWAFLERECGNMLAGYNEGAPNYAPVMSLTASGSVTDVQPGDTPTVSFNLANSGTAVSETGNIEILYPGPSVSTSAGTWSQSAIAGGGGGAAGGLRGNVPPFPGGLNWFWSTGAIPATLLPANNPVIAAGSLRFTIPTGAPVGNFTMRVYWLPTGGTAADLLSASVTFRVVSVRTPVISANNSDIHAGDCSDLTATGEYRAPGSVGQYVLSGSGAITGFQSNASSSITSYPDNLKMEFYNRLCRDNIFAIARADFKPGVSADMDTTRPIVDVSMMGGLWYWRSTSTLQITGTTNLLLTIVADGPVRIVGSGIHSSSLPAQPHAIPSLGIIANGDINIAPGATRADAYMFSNGTIRTCEGGGSSCLNTLSVRGFLMAKRIEFGRLGAAGTTGSPVTEDISMNPSIYLNPPRYFDASIDEVVLEGQGERAPLY